MRSDLVNLLARLFLTTALVVSAADAGEVPFLSGRVNDLAGMLKAETKLHLEAMLKAHEDSTSNQVVVLTVPDLGGESIEEYSFNVAQTWKLGQKGKNNGVLFLVSRDDRQMRIEVGTGLEGVLTDATSGIIIRQEVVPRFQDGDFDAGISDGVLAILAVIKGEYQADDPEAVGDFFGRAGGFLVFLIVVGIFTLAGVSSTGPASWFLYFFLMPFWYAFPAGLLGSPLGLIAFVLYLVGFPVLKFILPRTAAGKNFSRHWASAGRGGVFPSGGWSSRGGSYSGGGGFSGGGGGFGGGGASGRW
jgi:uncharacterized protein